MKFLYSTKPRLSSSNKGFALISTIAIMALLLVVGLAMMSLSSVETNAVSQRTHMQEARDNARMALMIALGELQKNAGPDQRVTASANITGDELLNPHWMGVWETTDASEPVWMVSGKDLAPHLVINEEATLLNAYTSPAGDLVEGITAGLVTINDEGRYAWVVTDEGVKARVNITDESDVEETYEKMTPARIPLKPDLPSLGTDFANTTDDNVKKLISLKTLDLATGTEEAESTYRHDVTVGGYGLPVNVVDGGMKVDLSSVFDTTSHGGSYQTEVMGATPVEDFSQTLENVNFYNFPTIAEPSTFYLDSLYHNALADLGNEGGPAGPNWGILFNYAQQWQQSSSGQTPITKLNPPVRADIRTNDWAPYRSAGTAGFAKDRQHTNSGITPVVSMLQLGTSLTAEALGSDPNKYQVKLQIKPLIGLWNPYNTEITDAQYNLAWAIYPYIRLGYNTGTGADKTVDIWLRDKWVGGGTANEEYINLTTPADKFYNFEPGEIRLFSVGEDAIISNENELVNTWSTGGGYTVSTGIPNLSAGATVWYEVMYLEDAQHPDAITRYSNQIVDGKSSSWVTLRTPDANRGSQLLRLSDLWQIPLAAERANNTAGPVPAQVTPATTDYNKVSVDSISKDTGAPHHIGTWRMSMRTSSQASDTQLIRTWLDSNPRFTAGNPAWNGSNYNGSSYEGLNFIAPWIGESDKGTKGDRGLIAEGPAQEADASPQGTLDGDRYLGYGGYSNSSSDGQQRVILYDIPRSPLVSLGQFQHAQLSRYAYESGFPFGNSYASSNVPLDDIESPANFNDIIDFTASDTSFKLNEALWDDFFFSTLAKGYIDETLNGTLDSLFPIGDLLSGEMLLPNPRYQYISDDTDTADTTLNDIHSSAGSQGMRAISSRIGIIGAFNINSTSKTAWKAVLSSMADYELPIMSEDGSHYSWVETAGVRFSKFGHHFSAVGWEGAGDPDDPAFWTGYRQISEDDLDDLAEAMVEEVKLRGPFRSFAEFVNRDPDAELTDSQQKGALQAALDRTINDADNLVNVGEEVADLVGANFTPEATDGESTSAGYAGFVTQADVLQSLAPILTPRSDYFCIRTKGESLDASGKVIASAYCEAYVQRTASYVDPADEAYVQFDDLTSEQNEDFGRKFTIISFRWLNSDEL